MKQILLGLSAVLVLSVAAVSSAELTPEQAKQAGELLRDFTAKEFAARQAAVEKLIAMGPDVLPLVKKALAETADAEVKLRCGMVLKAIEKPEGPVPPKGEEQAEEAVIELVNLKIDPDMVGVGGEMTITATLANRGRRVALTEVRLKPAAALKVLAPDVAQIVFIEPKKELEVKWRVKGVAPAEARCEVSFDVIAHGRPPAAPPRNVPADQKAAIEKPWKGKWESPGGFVYGAEMQLRVNPGGTVEGEIHWTLVEVPEGRADYDGKIGEGGTEFVWGLYDPATRGLAIEGYRRDDPQQVLGLDRYRLLLSADLSRLQGLTWDHGTWEGKFNLAPKPAP